MKRVLVHIGTTLMVVLAVVLTAVLVLALFTFLAYPLREYVALILALVVGFFALFLVAKLRRKMLKLAKAKVPVLAIIGTLTVGALMASLFWVPSKSFESTGSVVASVIDTKPEMITSHAGDKIATYVMKPEKPNGLDPIVYIPGGPGAAPDRSVGEYLNEYVKLGYTVYAFDPVGTGQSPEPKDYSSYSIKDEVGVVKDVADHYNLAKFNLIGHSYAGTVAGRFIAEQPERVNAYLAIDTSPLYTLGKTTPASKEKVGAGEPPKAVAAAAQEKLSQLFPSTSIARMVYGSLLVSLTGQKAPYGSSDEFDYYQTATALAYSGQDIPASGKLSTRLNYAANALINKSLEQSPDYLSMLKSEKTPPVLVIHSKNDGDSSASWDAHRAYRDYFSNVTIVPWNGGHHPWQEPGGQELLVKDGDALFRGLQITDGYAGDADPFAK